MTERFKSKHILLLLLLILIGVGAYFLFFVAEWIEEDIDLGFSAKARSNPYLAAQMFLEKHALNTEHKLSFPQTEDLPGIQDTMLISTDRHSLSETRSQAILKWVEEGGHAIIVAQYLYNEKTGKSSDLILDSLNIQRVSSDKKNHSEKNVKTEKQEEEANTTLEKQLKKTHTQCPAKKYIMPVKFANEDKSLQIAIDSKGHALAILEDSPKHLGKLSSSQNDDGVQILQIPLNKGTLSIFTDLELWTNLQIECYDHAYLLWLLTKNSPKVWFFTQEESPSLSALLWRTSPALVLSSLMLLLFWVWRQTQRFGPEIHIKTEQRRDFWEHLEASARFLWQRGLAQNLLEKSKAETVSKIDMKDELDFVKAVQEIQTSRSKYHE